MTGSLPVPRVSVVIPTYRRPQLLARCLDALAAQSLAGAAYEVIVVDDGRSEDTHALCGAHTAMAAARGSTLRYLQPLGTRGPAAARNRGWRAAAGDIVAFTDDDTVPDRDWLRAGAAALELRHRIAAWGRVHVPLPDIMTDNARNTAGLHGAIFVTANVFVRREALIAVGGFDERYLRAWREDTDLYFALLAAAPSEDAVVAAPDALVTHPVREAKFLMSVGQQANMAFDALLYKKFPVEYDRLIGLRHPPLYYCAIVAAALLALLILPFSRPVGAACGLMSLTLILRFALRRLRGLDKSPRHIADMVLSSSAIPFVSLYWRLVGALRWRAKFF